MYCCRSVSVLLQLSEEEYRRNTVCRKHESTWMKIVFQRERSRAVLPNMISEPCTEWHWSRPRLTSSRVVRMSLLTSAGKRF
jgi:hypothetical protein